MKPLAIHGGAAGALLWTAVGIWTALELGLAVHTRIAGGARDRSYLPLSLTVAGGIALAVFAARRGDLALPGGGWWPVALGIGVLVVGLALRAWAVLELGRFFKLTVVVQPDHRVIDTGPYRSIRHPSYTGLLLAMLGVGIALGTWLSIPAALLPPLAGFSIRIRREERVLARELGEPYRAYMGRTRRLIPGVW